MRYALAFLTLAALTSNFAVRLGGAWHLVHWFALDCLVVAAGYAGLGPRVFGKRSDGRLPAWSKLLLGPYLLYAAAVWRLSLLVSREPAIDRLGDDLLLARRLRPDELPEGVANIVDLTAEFEEPRAIRETTNYVSLPILDASVPEAEALRAAVESLPPGLTLVHCAQGHGRTGLFALAVLAQRGRIQSFEEGMELLRSARPGICLNRAQQAFVRDYLTDATR